MEREHLIIIALILVALYMMNKDTKDIVKAISPIGRIRYGICSDGSDPPCPPPLGHIRTRREGFKVDGMPERIRLGDKDYGKGNFIKSHVRHNNRNNMFSGMMGDCGGMTQREKFRMDSDNSSQDNIGEQQHIRGL